MKFESKYKKGTRKSLQPKRTNHYVHVYIIFIIAYISKHFTMNFVFFGASGGVVMHRNQIQKLPVQYSLSLGHDTHPVAAPESSH